MKRTLTPAAQELRRAPAGSPAPQGSPTMRSRVQRALLHGAAKPVLFLLCLAPLAGLFYGAATNQLGANPAEKLIRELGEWTLRLLWLTLTITPLRQLTGLAVLARFRRMLGVFSFSYASLHLLAYGWLDMGLALGDIAHDIAKRPFILMGFAAWALMLPLAATSFNRAIKALGAPRWQALHKAVYAVAVVGLMHFIWMRAGKNNFGEPAIYGALLTLLLGWRAVHALRRRPG